MRYLACIFLLLFCTCCSLTPDSVERARPGHDRAVVFDIDGTLTTGVRAIGDTRPGAVAAVQAYADAGYRIIYLSARHPLFQWQIPRWLERNGFPKGAIHVTETREQRKDPAAFKLGVLNEYRDNGWELIAAYGDSTTDFEAYGKAGIERGHVFALKRKGAENCEPGSWVECFTAWPDPMQIITENIQAD